MISEKISNTTIDSSSQNIYYLNQQKNDVKITLNSWTKSKFLIINIDAELKIDFDQQPDSETEIQIVNIHRQNKTKSICTSILNAGSKSNIYILSLLTKWSDIVVDGNIYMAPGAIWSSGHLLEENLVLDPDVRIFAKPVLDVQNSQVSASHAAKISKIDNKNLFYMMSRGLSREQATEIILDGYINKIIDKLTLADEEKEELKKLILVK